MAPVTKVTKKEKKYRAGNFCPKCGNPGHRFVDLGGLVQCTHCGREYSLK